MDVDCDLLDSVLGGAAEAVGGGTTIGTTVGTSSASAAASSSSSSSSSFLNLGPGGGPASLSSMGSFLSSKLKEIPSSKAASAGSGSTTAFPGDNNTNVAGSGGGTGAGALDVGKQMFSGLSKRMSLFGSSSLDTLKKSIGVEQVGTGGGATSDSSPALTSRAASGGSGSSSSGHSSRPAGSSAFVIDGDDDEDDDVPEDDGMGPRENSVAEVDPNKISISRTEQEKAQALAMHKLAGLRKGDKLKINREHLPGAVLFPAMKLKDIKPDVSALPAEAVVDAGVDTAAAAAVADAPDATAGSAPDAAATATEASSTTATSDPTAPAAAATVPAVEDTKQVLVHRFLVVTRERFLVLDSQGSGVGSEAMVKSNHHLTEVPTYLVAHYAWAR